MNKAKLYLQVAVCVLVITAAMTLVACSSDDVGPTTTTQREGRTDGDIYGYVYDAEGSEPLDGAFVVWYCETCNAWAGEDYTDEYGRYDIYAYPWYISHLGHDFVGSASKEGYQTDYRRIEDFGTYLNPVPVQHDFYLVPE